VVGEDPGVAPPPRPAARGGSFDAAVARFLEAYPRPDRVGGATENVTEAVAVEDSG
jgi:hypothetical protein